MDHGIRDSRAAGLLIITISTPFTPQAPGAPEPPRRRRRLDPESALFPATPEPVDEVQSPPAPANGNSAGAGAESSADAPPSTSH
ncbi:hypothetical protein Emag_007668 [Eimeria magna]